MQGMPKTPSELFAMLKTVEVEIKKEHVVFMVNKTVEFKKSGKRDKGKKGSPKKGGKPVVAHKAPKPGPKPGIECFYYKGDSHWKRDCPKYLEDKKARKIVRRDKGIFDIHVIDIFLTSDGSTSCIF